MRNQIAVVWKTRRYWEVRARAVTANCLGQSARYSLESSIALLFKHQRRRFIIRIAVRLASRRHNLRALISPLFLQPRSFVLSLSHSRHPSLARSALLLGLIFFLSRPIFISVFLRGGFPSSSPLRPGAAAALLIHFDV